MGCTESLFKKKPKEGAEGEVAVADATAAVAATNGDVKKQNKKQEIKNAKEAKKAEAKEKAKAEAEAKEKKKKEDKKKAKDNSSSNNNKKDGKGEESESAVVTTEPVKNGKGPNSAKVRPMSPAQTIPRKFA